MAILKLLSEEIFDYSAEQMTQLKTKNLKTQMCHEFSKIFELCNEVLEKAHQPSLIKATLETLLRFLNWIPLGYIFETNVIENLRNRFLESPDYRNVTLKCLTEIGALSVSHDYDEKFIALFNMVVASLTSMIPLSADIASIYNNSSNDEQEFIQNLALFLTSFLGAHLKIMEAQPDNSGLLTAHYYLLRISQVEEREIFKVCLEYWTKLVAELYEEIQQIPVLEMPTLSLTGAVSSPSALANIPLRKNMYSDILSNLRVIMIDRMVKPEEWDSTLAQVTQSLDALNVTENTKLLGHVLRTNVAACNAVGSGFSVQIARIYVALLELYKAVSQLISDSVARDAVLIDYNTNVEQARDAEVLSSMASIISKLGAGITKEVPAILNAVFECTLNMINKDFSEYPEHRVGFFKLLRAINQHCFPALLTLPPAQFKLIMDSIVWAFKHTMRDIAETGLNICLELLNNISLQDTTTANLFYQQYFLNLLQDVFFVLTDTDHKSGLFELNQDFNRFKLHLRDFLIQLKEFSGDNADLYLEEREAEAELRKKTEMENALKIPGLVKPSDLPMDEEE
ncbi:10877_t:CDS:10 [Acaulospora colombiana]|uniref:10877_t:CDS:1 n=1 Tax=Acaulospora colombiana TaxID=27376 RepID=A0ACA9LD45_9GLOM|nr:10877_t:CDS:10 [Acaulospora colombiana]